MPEPSPPSAGPSLEDVAAAAGVSAATVSRALRNKSNVSPGTRERVLAAARRLEYAISPMASGLVTGRLGIVGVIVPFVGRWFFSEVLHGVEEVLRGAGQDVVLHMLGDGGRREDFFEVLPVRRRVDALIVVGLALRPDELRTLRRIAVPIVSVGETNPGTPYVGIDNEATARTAVRHLVTLGHRDIACIGGDPSGVGDFRVPVARAAGFRTAMAEAGARVRPEWEVNADYTARGGQEAMTALLSSGGPLPTAVFCQSDEMAFGVLRALRLVGLRVPHDVSVVGIDGHELGEVFDLTTVSQPVRAQGARAGEWVVAALGDDGAAAGDTLLPTHAVLRGSTAPPPSGGPG